MDEGEVDRVRARIVSLADRLKAVEDHLRSASADAALTRTIQELAAIRGELHTVCERAPTTPLEASVDKERLARAISELKSGEFDMQG